MRPRFTKALAETTLTLPVGGSTAVELPFAASPQPRVTWSFNGGKLPDAKRFKTDTIRPIGMTRIASCRSSGAASSASPRDQVKRRRVRPSVAVLQQFTSTRVFPSNKCYVGNDIHRRVYCVVSRPTYRQRCKGQTGPCSLCSFGLFVFLKQCTTAHVVCM